MTDKPLYEKIYSRSEAERFVCENKPNPPPADPRAARFWAQHRAEQIRVARISGAARTRKGAA